MPAYLIARVSVSDPQQYKQYTDRTPGVIAKFGGKFIVRGGQIVNLEGPPESGRIVVIEFPSLEHVQAFYRSEEYQQIKKLRAGAATGSLIAVEGHS